MISIVIPTYNSAKTIKRCLESIVAQTYKDYEVLVMDGVSKDYTLSLVQSYNDSRIHIYSEPDKGIYDAMNKGILKSKGEWLYFLGSDDYLYAPDVLEKVAKELDPKFKIVYGDVEASQLQPEHKGEWNEKNIFYNRCHQAIFYHRTLFEKYGLYNTKYRILADYEYNLLCFWRYHVPSKYIKVVIAHYSDGGISVCREDKVFEKDSSLIYLRLKGTHFSTKKRIQLARNVIINTDSLIIKGIMYTYIYIMRISVKFRQVLNFILC